MRLFLFAAATVALGFLLPLSGQEPAKPPAADGGKGVPRWDEAVKAQPPVNEPPKARVPLSDADCKQHLDRLFKWTKSESYQYYLFMLAQPVKISEQYAVQAAGLKSDQDRLFVNPYNKELPPDKKSGPCITISYPTQFKPFPNNNGICVHLDGIGKPVPVQAAEVMAGGFAQGFVTRMVLGEYVRAWNEKGAGIPIDSLNFASNWNPSLPSEKDIEKFADLNSYLVGDKNKKLQYDVGLANLLRTNNLQAVGLLYGWKAASELDAFRDAKNGDKVYFDTALSLVKKRFSPEEIGGITSYTLHYLLGYTRIVSERQKPGAAVPPAANNDQILARLEKDEDVTKSMNFINLFYGVMLDEYQAIMTSAKRTETETKKMQAYYHSFLKGFHAGSTKAVDDIAILGYQTGYRDGFKDGYSRGYAAGLVDGYAAGHKKAWDEANKVIDSMRFQLEQYKKEMDGLRAANEDLEGRIKKRESIGSYLEDVGRGILKGALSLFGL